MTKQTVSEKAATLRQNFFTQKIGEYTIEPCTREACRMMTREHLYKVFPKYEGYNPKSKEITTLRPCLEEYEKIHTEFFLVFHKKKAIGWFMGEMEDFETFYMRNTGILPRYQGRGIYSAFLDRFIDYVTMLGYQRISSHHLGHNKRIFKLKMAQGFQIVGTENHEKWGSLVKMVKFLNKRREQFFIKKFH